MEPPATNRSPGAVWIISGASSVLSIGLENALRMGGFGVHHRPEPPAEEGVTSVVVCAPTTQDELTSAVNELRQLAPQAAVVVFGASGELSLARAAVGAGADGFLHAGMTSEQLARALHKAQGGHKVLPRELLGELVKEMGAKERRPDLSKLGARTVEILEMAAEGLTNAQIAKKLYLSESTIKQHLRMAYKALGVKNKNQAARLMRRRRGP
jgi:DNA-binding NarL/FixJ family response regulator